MIIAYLLTLLLLALYSYSLMDLNLTLVNHPLWELFRENIIQLGYFRRDLSWVVYAMFVVALFIFHYFMVKNHKKINPLHVAFIVGGILLFSYPFLSHDFFNYLFDAKILTFYHQNPYLHKALDFPQDPWIRFMHWTHRNYPYGPTFLLISAVPSFLSFGKFVLNILFFKVLFVGLYLGAVVCLQKMNKRWAMIFATHPLILIEGLINSHNDFIALCLSLVGIYLLSKRKRIGGRLVLLVSAGIKYMSAPAILVGLKNKKLNYVAFIATILIITYVSITISPQPWYFLNLLIFLPFFEGFITKLNLLFMGLLLSYYPLIRLGGWSEISYKYTIIWVALFLNVLVVAIFYVKDRKNNSSQGAA